MPDAPASLHRVEIETAARAHAHRDATEIDYILECAAGATVELDGGRVAAELGGAELILLGVRHRAAGRMTTLNAVVPPFDPADERSTGDGRSVGRDTPDRARLQPARPA